MATRELGNVLGNPLARPRSVAAVAAMQEVWVATGAPVTISMHYTKLVIDSNPTPQICVLPDDGSIFLLQGNGSDCMHRTLRCTESGLVNKYTESATANNYAFDYAGPNQYPMVPVGACVYTRNFGAGFGMVNTNTGSIVNSVSWDPNGTGYSFTNYLSMAWDPVGQVGIGVAFDGSQSRVATFNPENRTTIAVTAQAAVNNLYPSSGGGAVIAGKYYSIAYTPGQVLSINTDLTGQSLQNLNAYESGGSASITALDQPYRLLGGSGRDSVKIISGRTRTSNTPNISGFYTGRNNRGLSGEFLRSNLSKSFLGFEYSPPEICIGSEICTPVLNTSGDLCWVNYYNGSPVPPQSGVTLRINANYGVSFPVGGTTIQMYKIVQQAI
jgi:hypothetical protein